MTIDLPECVQSPMPRVCAMVAQMFVDGFTIWFNYEETIRDMMLSGM